MAQSSKAKGVLSEERKLRAEVAILEEKLSVQARELGRVEIALIASGQELEGVQADLTAFTTKLADLTLRLFDRTTQLDESNQKLLQRTEELQASNASMHLLEHEKECFVALLRDLTNPMIGNTRILEHIAAGKASPEKQSELFKLLVDFNKSLLAETDHLTSAFLKLSDEKTAEVTGAANAQLTALKLVMQQREDFVATLIHDLKNPLTGCSRVLGLIAEGTVNVAQHPELITQLVQAHKSMLHLIWNTMEVYKDDLGCLIPVAETFDLNALLRQCLNEFSFSISEKALTVTVNAGEAPHMVDTDRRLLSRVLMNLLDNAVKFTTENGQLIASITEADEQAVISIMNSGTGLTDNERERIFDRFCQTSAGRQYGVGTGLGLFLSKQIMHVLGGQILCTSTIGVGAEFIVRLPVEPIFH